MNNIRIPIKLENTIEVIIADVFVSFQVKILPETPIQSMQGKMALQAIESKLNEIGFEVAAKISNEIQKSMNEKN